MVKTAQKQLWNNASHFFHMNIFQATFVMFQ